MTQLDKIEKDIRHYGISVIKLMFTDLEGFFRSLEIPAKQLNTALNGGQMFDGSSIKGFAKISKSDLFLNPDVSTWKVLEWTDETIGVLICDIYNLEGKPFDGCPRTNLKRVREQMIEHGFTKFNVGFEPEFFIFEAPKDEKGKFQDIHKPLIHSDHGSYFSNASISPSSTIRREIVEKLEECGIEVEKWHHEVARSQHEINIKFASDVQAADNFQIYKYIVKKIAGEHGYVATFMPKPIEGINGSGLHANLSLMDAEGNAFSDHNDENAISTTAYKFLSGILNHASAFTAITNPTVNSYKRLVPGYEAPVYIAFSKSNRSCFVRIPGVPGNASRIEVRSVDATCNPYLAIAVLLAAGLEGIKSTDSKMPEAEQIDLFTKTLDEVKAMGIEALPESLEHALYRLEKDSVIIDALGLTIYENFRAIKWEEYREFKAYVTDWEISRYIKY